MSEKIAAEMISRPRAAVPDLLEPQRGDVVEGWWSRKMLLRMDARFVARLERAISDGHEHRPDDKEDATRQR